MWLIGEPVATAKSLAMTLLVPGGLVCEPTSQLGVGGMLAEIVCRGAAGLSAREHTEALDQLGIQRGTSVETRHLRLGATMISQNRSEALPLLLDMIRRPNFDEQAMEPSRALALQAIDALADEPQQRVMLQLKENHYPQPLNRSPLGDREHLQNLTLEQVRQYWQRTCVPGGAILSFAGDFDWNELRSEVLELLGDWSGECEEPTPASQATRGYQHLEADTSQVHIGLAYDAVSEPDDNSILQRAATAVLSGGMSGRLFTEVREKRGLCYAVYASYAGQRDRGLIMGYAGTTTPRAQETLDVMVQELRRLSQGVTESEFQRAIVGMKSRLVMQGESTSARANALAHDQYVMGRPRSLDELAQRVDSVTLDKLNAFVSANPPGDMTIVTIGPNALSV